MKIERTKVKKSSSEVPLDCRNLIDKLKVRFNFNSPSSLIISAHGNN